MGRVTGSSGSILLERSSELAKSSNSGGGSATIILVYCNSGLVTVLILNNGVVWGDLSLEKSSLKSGSSFLMTLESKCILSKAIDTKFSSNIL